MFLHNKSQAFVGLAIWWSLFQEVVFAADKDKRLIIWNNYDTRITDKLVFYKQVIMRLVSAAVSVIFDRSQFWRWLFGTKRHKIQTIYPFLTILFI